MTTIGPCPNAPTDRLARRIAERPQFGRMVERQGIALQTIAWPGLEGMLGRALDACARCPAKARCAAWLEGGDAPACYVSFCPNAEAIEILRIMAP